ncbi:uncharacterized protein LOC114587821 isoform X4 [Podarcis muralis]
MSSQPIWHLQCTTTIQTCPGASGLGLVIAFTSCEITFTRCYTSCTGSRWSTGSGLRKEFCEICVARERQTDRLYICKKFLKKDGRKVRRAAKNEILILKMVSHPNILQLIDTFETRKEFYIIQELATGGDVFDWILDQGYYTEKDASNVVRQVLEALAYLHNLHIVHRNLKLLKWLLGNAMDVLLTAGLLELSCLFCCLGTPRSTMTQMMKTATATTAGYSAKFWLGTTTLTPPIGMTSLLPPKSWCHSLWKLTRTNESLPRRHWDISGYLETLPLKRTSRKGSAPRLKRTLPRPNGGKPFVLLHSCNVSGLPMSVAVCP